MSDFFKLPFLDSYALPVLGSVALVLFLLEFVVVLRTLRYNKWQRWFHNVAMSIIGLPAARLLLLPLTFYYASLCEQWHVGLLNWFELPFWLTSILGVLLLDYGIYLWHRLNHVIPFLWRFHNVHHADQDMDISTAIRFHFGEMLLSIPFRLVVITASGVPPVLLLIYEIIFEAATLFHHSNIKLPLILERVLAFIIITPRQHGIHHSIVQQETNSNYGTVFNWWDKLHSTSRRNIPQNKIIIGVPGIRDAKENRVGPLLLLPFKKRQPEWKLPNGVVPQREPSDESERII